MKIFQFLLKFLPLVPVVVAGVEQVHGDLDGPGKKQAAMDALALATGVAQNTVPSEFQPAVGAFSELASFTIDNTVKALNAAGVFKSKPKQVVPAS